MRLILIYLVLLIFCSSVYGQSGYTQPGFFRTKRQLPLVKINTTQEISVSSYGAVANDGKDDIQSITNAIHAAKTSSSASSPVRVVFEKGTYDLFGTTGNSHSIFVTDAKSLVLDGNGAEIMLHNPEVGFLSLLRCENVIVQNMFVDYAKLPFTQGKVLATDAANSTFDLQIDEGFPLLNEAYFTNATEKWGMLKEETGQLKKGVTNLFPYRGWTLLSGNVFRVKQPNASYIDQIEVGDYFVQIARNNGKTIFLSNAGKNITYLNITSYASPAGTYNTFNHYEWNIINCRILPKAGRVQSANADCIHISGGYIGPWVEGCRFEAYSDDAVNMKYANREILSVQNAATVTVKYFAQKGDTICFYNPREGKLLGRVHVNLAVNEGNNNYRITLSEPVKIENISSHQSGDKAYVDTQACESFVFRNDTMRNGRRYGMLLQNCYGVIENCLFENLSSSGIKIENGADWGEGFTAHDIKITNNKFVNCGFDTSFLEDDLAASISSRITKLGTPCDVSKTWCGVETADWTGLKNIEISGNIFEFNKAAVNLNNIDGGMLGMNQFRHNPSDVSLPVNNDFKAISINNCRNFSNMQTTNTSKLEKESDINIYFQDNILDVKFLRDQKEFQHVGIYDGMGKQYRLVEVKSTDLKIKLSGLSNGVYIVRAVGPRKTSSEKFIKN